MKKFNFNTGLGKVVGIAVFIIAFAVTGVLLHHPSDTTNGPNALTSDTSWRSYTSTKFGFKQSFPGNPTAKDTTTTIQNVSVPLTMYERDNGNSYYLTEVVSYPSQVDMSDTDARLEGALNGSVENTKGATLTSSSFTQLAGYRAITGVASITQGNESIQEREAAFLKGNTMFVFIGSGASASDFNTFTSSFQFTQ